MVVAEVRAMEGWLPENFELAGGGLACIGLGEDGSTYLASNVLGPSAKAQQPAHTDFSPRLWDWDTDGVKGSASRMEQLCVHALLVQLYATHLVAEGEVPPAPGPNGFGSRAALGYGPAEDSLRRPVWLGKDYQQNDSWPETQEPPKAAGSAVTGAPFHHLWVRWPHRWNGWSRCWWGEAESLSDLPQPLKPSSPSLLLGSP